MSAEAVLLTIALIIALVSIVGGLIVLLKQQVVVDEKGTPTEIDLGAMGKFRTNYPSLVGVVVGGLIVWAVLEKVDVRPEQVPLVARLALEEAQRGEFVFVGAIPERYLRATNVVGAENEVSFDVDAPDRYSVVAFTLSGVREDGSSVYSVTHGPATFDAEARRIDFQGRLLGN